MMIFNLLAAYHLAKTSGKFWLKVNRSDNLQALVKSRDAHRLAVNSRTVGLRNHTLLDHRKSSASLQE